MHRHIRTHKQHPERSTYDGESDVDDDGGSTDSSNSYTSAGSHNNNNNNNYSKGDQVTLEGRTEKRKSADDDLTNVRRKMRAIHNNNNNNVINSTKTFSCPVCIRDDFSSWLSLESHMDQEHPSIPAKCRHCEMVFKSHKALNAHVCGNGNKFSARPISQGYLKEQTHRTYVDFSSESFPKGYNLAAVSRRLQRADTDSEVSEDELETKRDDFFANLDLQNKSQPMSLSSNAGTSELMSTPSTDKSFTSPYSLKERLMSPYQNDTKDLADIQSIINVTSSSGGFWKQLDRAAAAAAEKHDMMQMHNDDSKAGSVNDEEEAQDSFTAEFRKMKLRGEFPCRLCTAVFPNLRALKGHNRIHLSAAGPGPYRCNMCPYIINDKAALIRHMRTHNGDRPYECKICNYAFTTKANCERHLRNRHGKNTRDEIKQAIIYHPSEDSSCDDPVKKMAMFSPTSDTKNPEGHPPKASTPVSHLVRISSVSFEPTPKIQVRSLEKLIEPNKSVNSSSDLGVEPLDEDEPVPKPVDLSMDVLDLSKKAKSVQSRCDDDNSDSVSEDNKPEMDLNLNQQILMLQQKFLSEALPKLNPAHYFQLLYRNFGFPSPFPLHPLLMQNSLMGGAHPDESLKGFLPAAGQMSGGSLLMNPFASPPTGDASAQTPTKVESPKSHRQEQQPVRSESPLAAVPEPQPPTSTPIKSAAAPLSPGSVKMVIKNGVLMPKQKQRRYRTERPFACEHCSARFTLRSNMERHIKQQHPQYWAQRQKGGHHLMRRGSGGSSAMHSLIPQNITAPNFSPNAFGISDNVKFAILAQQLNQHKARNEAPSMILHNALSNGHLAAATANNDDDEPKLVIDEEDDASLQESPVKQSPSQKAVAAEQQDANEIARKIAQDFLEQAKQINTTNSIILSTLKEKKESSTAAAALKPNYNQSKVQASINKEKEKEEDLASISKLVDNATMSFGNYFK